MLCGCMDGASIRELKSEKAELEKLMAELPIGYISRKTINGKVRYYHQWYSDGKVVSKYLRESEVEPLSEKIELRRGCKLRIGEIDCEIRRLKEAESGNGCHNLVRKGFELEEWAWRVDGWKRRDCYRILQEYLCGDDDRVCILYGLRRTGKTTMIRQSIIDMTSEEAGRTAYITVKSGSTMADLSEDIRVLRSEGMRTVFIDEITSARDFIVGASLLSDLFVPSGMRIVLSGTDSLGFWFAEDDALLGRAVGIHTTYISFREHFRLLGIPDVDLYIRYGGTLSIGQYYLEDHRFEKDENEFDDPDMAWRYTNRAIARNIQNTLKLERGGSRFEALRELYQTDELTNVINRVVEDITHRFVISVVEQEYTSDNLESAAINLSNANVSLYNAVNRAAVLDALKRKLSILGPEQRTTDITADHLNWLRLYLKALDVIAEYCVVDSVTGTTRKGIIITQPGLRFAQVEALVESLDEDDVFRNQVESLRNRILDVVMNTVRGRMLEEIVLFDTMKALGSRFEVFRLILSSGDVDMVVCERSTGRCLMFEVKHGKSRSDRQTRHLLSEEAGQYLERMYGPVVGKYVLYRGENGIECGVRYLNIEDYLRNLPESASGLFANRCLRRTGSTRCRTPCRRMPPR